jgi:predicted RNA binding protein YcfA (HicA-like mRNA interferase family)
MYSGVDVVKVLRKLGFETIRQKGSHVILRKKSPDMQKTCVVPMHKELAYGTFKGVLKQADVAESEFLDCYTK